MVLNISLYHLLLLLAVHNVILFAMDVVVVERQLVHLDAQLVQITKKERLINVLLLVQAYSIIQPLQQALV